MISKGSLAKIHIARAQLGMDEDTYRAMLRTHGGVSSAKGLSPVGAAKVLAHLERCGFKPQAPTKGLRPATAKDRDPLLGKIEAMLAAARRPWSYADAMAKRMFKVEQVGLLDSEQMGKVVAALSYDANRHVPKG